MRFEIEEWVAKLAKSALPTTHPSNFKP